MQSRKLWVVVGACAIMLAYSGYCLFQLSGADNPAILHLAGQLIDAVTTIILGYLGANVLGKGVAMFEARKHNGHEPAAG